MAIDKAKEMDLEKLVQDIPLISLDIPVPKAPCTKKRIRKLALAHIEGREKKGKDYYYYRRGIDPLIYLGDADKILQAIKAQAEAQKSYLGRTR